jgi:nitrate reductase NapAB chaperone NapD
VTIASWLVRVDKGRGSAVRRALLRPGIECRSEAYDTLVVVSESPADPHALDRVEHVLRCVSGVRDVSLVARFDGDERRAPARCFPTPAAVGA